MKIPITLLIIFFVAATLFAKDDEPVPSDPKNDASMLQDVVKEINNLKISIDRIEQKKTNIPPNYLPQIVKDYLPPVVTLFAAFLGAWFAFFLQNRKQEKILEKEQKLSANKAVFSLFLQFNQLLSIQKNSIDPFRKKPALYLHMSVLPPIKIEDLTINLSSLSFLLETEYREILFELLVEEKRFQAAIQATNERSKFHLNIIQPLLDKAGVQEGKIITESEIEKILGHKNFVQIRRATDQAIEHIDDTIESMIVFVDKFHQTMRKIYPGHYFLTFEKKNAQQAN